MPLSTTKCPVGVQAYHVVVPSGGWLRFCILWVRVTAYWAGASWGVCAAVFPPGRSQHTWKAVNEFDGGVGVGGPRSKWNNRVGLHQGITVLELQLLSAVRVKTPKCSHPSAIQLESHTMKSLLPHHFHDICRGVLIACAFTVPILTRLRRLVPPSANLMQGWGGGVIVGIPCPALQHRRKERG